MQAMQRHGQPGRTVFGFICDLVGGLFQAEQFQCRALAVGHFPGMGHGGGGQAVGFDEGVARLVQVLPGDPLTRLLRWAGKVDRRRAAQDHRSSIVEGTQHAADILVRAVFCPALLQWT